MYPMNCFLLITSSSVGGLNRLQAMSPATQGLASISGKSFSSSGIKRGRGGKQRHGISSLLYPN